MLGLLLVPAILGIALWGFARQRAVRWLGAGLLVLSLLSFIWIVMLLRNADRPPDPLPEVQRAIASPTLA